MSHSPHKPDSDEPSSKAEDSSRHDDFGLAKRLSLFEKLGYTITMLVLAGFLFIFSALVFTAKWNQWGKIPVELALEVCWIFWLIGTVFIWWKPPWLRRLYASAARKMVFVARLSVILALVLLVLAIVLLRKLFQDGVLPVR